MLKLFDILLYILLHNIKMSNLCWSLLTLNLRTLCSVEKTKIPCMKFLCFHFYQGIQQVELISARSDLLHLIFYFTFALMFTS